MYLLALNCLSLVGLLFKPRKNKHLIFFSIFCVFVSFVCFYTYSDSNILSQDKLQYFISWYLPSQISSFQGIFRENDFLLRIIFYIFPNNLSIHIFYILFSVIFISTLVISVFYQNFLLQGVKSFYKSYLVLLFLLFDRLNLDLMFNGTRSYIACLLFVSFVLSKSRSSVIFLILCLFTHAGAFLLSLIFYIVYCLFKKKNSIFFIYFLIASFSVFIFKWVYFLIYEQSILREFTNSLGIFVHPNYCDKLLNVVGPFHFSDLQTKLTAKVCNFRSFSTIMRGVNNSSQITSSIFIQLIIFFSPLFLIIFDGAKLKHAKQVALYKISLFFISLFLIIYPDFYLSLRLLVIPALVLSLLLDVRKLVVLVLIKFIIFNVILFKYFI